MKAPAFSKLALPVVVHTACWIPAGIGRGPADVAQRQVITRKIYDEVDWTGYEVFLPLWPDVFAYGILLLPRPLEPAERRPVVVCQHGLEGRPQDVIKGDREAEHFYHNFAANLANHGFVVYRPQNPYFGYDKFRKLQRLANPLKLSLFSFILAQHERTLDWLAGQSFRRSQADRFLNTMILMLVRIQARKVRSLARWSLAFRLSLLTEAIPMPAAATTPGLEGMVAITPRRSCG